MKRRAFLAATAALTGVSVARRKAQAGTADAVATQFLWIKNVEYAGFFIADAKGFYRDAGIAPTFLAGGPNLASVEALVAGGRADVGVDDIEKITDAMAQGADFVVVGAIYHRSVGGILSLPHNPVRKPADLVGKRVGLQQGGKEYIDTILAINNLAARYTEVPVGFDPAPLASGRSVREAQVPARCRCYITNQPLVLAARNIAHVVTSLDALGFPNYDGCLFTTRAYLRDHRDVLVRYVRETARGWRANTRDPVLGATLAVQVYGSALGLELPGQIAQTPVHDTHPRRASGHLRT